MIKRENLYKQFIKYEWPQQMGNLASTLARLSSLVADVEYDETSRKLLREAALLIEWSAPNLPKKMHYDLAFIQREICYWYRIPLQPETRRLLSLRCRSISDYLLDISGCLSASTDSTALFSIV